MNTVAVRIPTPLRKFTGGAQEVRVPGNTVGEALGNLTRVHIPLRGQMLTKEGDLRPFVNVFVGDKDVRSLQGLSSRVEEGDVISIVPAVAGGHPMSGAGGDS
jgi:molybdopterin synthase sulfur carrier subunit